MREALQIVGEVGLENMWARHKRLHEDMWAGLQQLGLEPFVEDPADRLVTVNTIKVILTFFFRMLGVTVDDALSLAL